MGVLVEDGLNVRLERSLVFGEERVHRVGRPVLGRERAVFSQVAFQLKEQHRRGGVAKFVFESALQERCPGWMSFWRYHGFEYGKLARIVTLNQVNRPRDALLKKNLPKTAGDNIS
jgi:hypothetical protein